MRARPLVLALVICGVGAAAALAQEWTGWRGPSRAGTAPAFKAPDRWPDRPTKVWSVPAGLGHSSPIVAERRVYLFSRPTEQEALAAYDLASGRQLWQKTYDASYDVNPAAARHGKGPKSTPVFDAARVFTFGISGILSAWQARDGQLLWRKDFSATSPEYGTATSPLVAEGLLIVFSGGPGNGALMALDAAKGVVRWEWKGDGPAYSSPVVANFSGVAQVIVQSQRHLVAVALRDGRPLWQIPFTTSFNQNIVTPLVVGDLLIYSGFDQPLTAVRAAQQGTKWSTEEAWRNESLPNFMSTPVAVGSTLFGLTQRNKGQFFAADARTGKTLWVTKGREGDNAALVAAGDVVIAATTEGELVILKSNPNAFEVVKRYTVADSPIWAHPVPVENGLLVKDERSLAYFRF
jgi:outer membrane protein assembly factor BamB